MSIGQEFKEFIMRGNVVDMAVGIAIGAAFGKIVNSLVNDIIMPPIGKISGGVDFSNLFINMGSGEYASLAEAQKAGAPTINYGMFINNILDFLIIGIALFIVIKAINTAKRRWEKQAAAPAPAEPTAEVKLLTEIRDQLKSRN